MARTAISALTVLCLGFTGAGTAWADESQDVWIEDPYQPHDATGAEVRIGSLVGILALDGQEYTGLGGAVAVGHRWDRLAIDAEYGYMTLTERGPSTYRFGVAHELGIDVRYDVIRLGPRIVGENSLLSVYVEGGGGTAWNHWYRPAHDEHSRLVPADTRRPEAIVGVGIALDHRLQEPIGFPHRVGWFLGWRVSMSPHQPMTASVCRGVSCRPVEMMDEERLVDRSMLFQSSLAFTF
jgi:hypothetical protein